MSASMHRLSAKRNQARCAGVREPTDAPFEGGYQHSERSGSEAWEHRKGRGPYSLLVLVTRFLTSRNPLNHR